jgi:signal transduction histidine kinase
MTPGAPTQNEHATAADNDRLAELFHELAQPLTTLHCCLELSLKKVRSSKSRRDLQIALQQAENIAKLISQLREVLEGANATGQHHDKGRKDFKEPAPPLTWPSRCCG